METIKKITITALFSLFIFSHLNGQSSDENYKMSFGLGYGETAGIDFKYHTTNDRGLEMLAGIWSDWINLTGLYEKYTDALNAPGLRWYYGAGGHIAFRTGSYYNEGRYYSRGDEYALGLDGIIGIEYKIPRIPFAVSLDLKPLVEMYRDGGMYFSADPGLGVKFTF